MTTLPLTCPLVSEDLQDGRRFGVLTIENPFRGASS
jgi:predicted nucleic acid-binding protein